MTKRADGSFSMTPKELGAFVGAILAAVAGTSLLGSKVGADILAEDVAATKVEIVKLRGEVEKNTVVDDLRYNGTVQWLQRIEQDRGQQERLIKAADDLCRITRKC